MSWLYEIETHLLYSQSPQNLALMRLLLHIFEVLLSFVSRVPCFLIPVTLEEKNEPQKNSTFIFNNDEIVHETNGSQVKKKLS